MKKKARVIPAEDSVVLVGDGGKNRKKRLLTVLVVAAILIAAIAAGAALRWWQDRGAGTDTAASSEEIAKVASDAQDLTLHGDFDQAHEALDKALADPGLSADERYGLIFQKGLVYENRQQYDLAVNSYLDARSVKDGYDVNQSIARVAEAKGDKGLAIEYYKKAIPLIPDEDPRHDALKRYYEESVVRLGGQL